MHVVDSSGWLEYFLDTPRADWFAPAIEDRHRLLVPTLSLFEVCRVLSRKVPPELVTGCLDVMRLGRVVDLTDTRAVAAAHVARAHNLAMADAVMLSIAREFNATLWTQDADYAGLAGVRYFPKPSPG
ncbi:type II toxin-antitoxin system VapC family toxin [Tepidimonas taiwanensis]|uniref:type II toxin-antitoxin system VapC family toxin n=1 Tax=Tepidimonas taiwanensis TaxID=307486 RepID=UPI0005B94BFB|nr:type II toxin-antitoxin system VapC family toxin [Tepidimonas taiwanensis]